MDKHPFSNLTPEHRAAVDKAVIEFTGFSDHLSAALGALAIGHFVGWRGLLMVHGRGTLKGYEAILGFRFQDALPERTSQTERLLGIRIAEKLGKYWAVVKGEVSVEGGKGFISPDGQEDLFGGQRGRAT